MHQPATCRQSAPSRRTVSPRAVPPRVTLLTALALAASLASGCGGGRTLFGPRSAWDAAPLRVERALALARAAALDPDELELPVRYNPTSCDCPAWEVLIAESWRRVALEPEPPTRGAPLRSLTLRPTDATVEAEGWIYAVYAVVR